MGGLLFPKKWLGVVVIGPQTEDQNEHQNERESNRGHDDPVWQGVVHGFMPSEKSGCCHRAKHSD